MTTGVGLTKLLIVVTDAVTKKARAFVLRESFSVRKAAAYPSRAYGLLRLAGENLFRTNALAYFAPPSVTKTEEVDTVVNSISSWLMRSPSPRRTGANVIKLFTA
jgi:hypothetical protein